VVASVRGAIERSKAMTFRRLLLVEWLVCLVAPAVPVPVLLLMIDHNRPFSGREWTLFATVAVVMGVFCLVAHTAAEGRKLPAALLVLPAVLASPVSGILGGGIALVGGSGPWSLLAALLVSPVGFCAGCGLLLADWMRRNLARARRPEEGGEREGIFREVVPAGNWPNLVVGREAILRERSHGDAYLTGESRQGTQEKMPDPPADRRNEDEADRDS
jgi:hypothetical protein